MSQNQFLYSKNFNPGHYAVRAIVLYLRTMFQQNADLEFVPYLDSMTKEEAYDALLITTKHDWETTYRNKRPLIAVSRGNLIAGISGTQGQGRLFSITDNGETTTYSDLVSLPIMVECLSESDIQCELLASIVSAFLSLDARPLRSLGMQIQGSPTQTSPQLFERGNTSFISSVIISVQIARQYKAHVIGLNALEDIKILLNNSVEINIE